MAAYTPHLPAVLIGVGASFDFMAGTLSRAPLWMQRMGLEWLHRFMQEPRRLWKRYLVTNVRYLLMLAEEMVRKKNPEI
jgi:N-acetylglucosaminyldiphosphoundecaprenol N-acetyl-beta-D-mannosaminyltransferase